MRRINPNPHKLLPAYQMRIAAGFFVVQAGEEMSKSGTMSTYLAHNRQVAVLAEPEFGRIWDKQDGTLSAYWNWVDNM